MNPSAGSVVLVGFMGAGKSAVGRELARQTGLSRYDTDEMVRERFGISIPDIFEQYGEQGFRDAETDALHSLHGRTNLILVTGGGIVLREENVSLLRALGKIVWLHASEDVLWERASRRKNRPLLQGLNPRMKFADLFRERLPLYETAADLRIDTSNASIGNLTAEIAKLL